MLPHFQLSPVHVNVTLLFVHLISKGKKKSWMASFFFFKAHLQYKRVF